MFKNPFNHFAIKKKKTEKKKYWTWHRISKSGQTIIKWMQANNEKTRENKTKTYLEKIV